jgi:hypothetical protein
MTKLTKEFVESHQTRCKIEKELTEEYRPDYEPHLGTHEHYSPYGHELHKISKRDMDELVNCMLRLLVHLNKKLNK